MNKLKQYAKGVAAAVGLAGTVAVEALPVDSSARLYAGIAVAVATLVTVVTVRNAKVSDDVDAAESLLARLEQLPALARFDSQLSALAAALERIKSVPPTVVVNNAPTEDTVPHVAPTPAPVAGPVVGDPAVVLDPVATDPAGPVALADAAPAGVASIPAPPVPPVDPPAVAPVAEDASAGTAPVEADPAPAAPAVAPAAGLDDGVTLPDDVEPPSVGILTD